MADESVLNTTEQIILLLAREREWAEAWAVDHPDCDMGRLYLQFLHREIDELEAGQWPTPGI